MSVWVHGTVMDIRYARGCAQVQMMSANDGRVRTFDVDKHKAAGYSVEEKVWLETKDPMAKGKS